MILADSLKFIKHFLSLHDKSINSFNRQKRREEEENKKRIQREAEENEKARLDAAKREKESAKRAMKRERKQLQNYCKQSNYFSSSEEDHVTRMADLDRLCELLSIEE